MTTSEGIPPRSPDFSVVVCAYTEDRWHQLERALASVRAQTVKPREVIVVVDHNRTLRKRLESTIAGVVALDSRETAGLAGARNTGVAAARGEIVAFLDDDAAADPGWLEALAAAYEEPGVVGVGGQILPVWSMSRPGWLPPEFDWVVGCTYRGMPTSTSRVRNVIGANMSFRREVLQRIRFYSGLGHADGRSLGGEETDLCIRIRQRWPEKEILYEPRARVTHEVPAERARWGYFISRCFNEGLSKAVLTRRVGSEASLATERAYVIKALSLAPLRAVAESVAARDPLILVRLLTLTAGLTATAIGYVVGVASRRSSMS